MLAGDGVMIIDGEEVELRPGRHVFVAAESVRQPIAGPDGLSWVVVGAPPQDGGRPSSSPRPARRERARRAPPAQLR